MGYPARPPDQNDPPEGPPIDVRSHPGLQVAVQRAYGGVRSSANVLWAGKMLFILGGKPFQEIEASLMRDKTGGPPWVALPSREFLQNGETRRARTVFFRDQSVLAAIVEAIEAVNASLAQERPF